MSIKRTVPVLLSAGSNLKNIDLNRIPGVHFQVFEHPDSTLSAISKLGKALNKAEIIIGDPPAVGSHWYSLPSNVKWIQSTWAGVDILQRQYINPQRPPPGFIFTRLGSGFGPYIADYIVGQIISRERHFDKYVRDQDNKKWLWEDRIYGGYRKVSDLTVGLLGVGNIGQQVAKICKACGMRVCGLVRKDISVHERSPFVDEYL
jgi:phosphoglycerate dehydrogenase-like enzyme